MKIIDLTHSISEKMLMYPGTASPTLQVAYNCMEHGFMETLVTIYSHTGTHIDTPAHLYTNGLTLDKYPIEQFVGRGLVMDCRDLVAGENITMKLLESKGSTLFEAEFILFFTGHSALWGKQEYFENYPIMSEEVVEWINHHQLKGIGIDAPSFDPITMSSLDNAASDLHTHRAILKTGKTVLIENLCNLEKVGNELFMLYALPLPLSNADGAPARVVAVKPVATPSLPPHF